jgi:hypothetical protein
VFTAVVALIVGGAVVEAASGLPVYGISTRVARASADGVDLEVRYPRLTRGQLDSPVHVNVRRSGGFDGPVTIAISSSYLALFITNDVTPQPSSESDSGEVVSMTFDPPDGDALSVDLDLAARPAGWFEGRAGTVSIVGQGTSSDAIVSIHTNVRP